MPKLITNSGKTLPRIKQTGKTLERIDPKSLGKLLGAEVVSTKAIRPGSPVSLFALRQYLLENLHSSGGRPALEEDASRQKIPLSDEAWQALTTLANILRAEVIPVSPGQMASAIVRQGLTQMNLLPVPKASQRKAA